MSAPARSRSPRRQILAVIIGNAIEWYDFVIFGILAGLIARVFFPAGASHTALLLALATFGVGFVMRPVGGLCLGIYADRKGRRAALNLILGLMTLATAVIALLPGYASIGLAAPLLVVLARLVQGFATGGEFATATSFLLEMAPPGRRGFYAAWQMVGQCLAVFFGVGIGYVLTHRLTDTELLDWGWRLPFLLGLAILPISLWIRRHLQESEAFVSATAGAAPPPPLAGLLRAHWRDVLVVMGLAICGTVAFYVLLIYMPTFASTMLGIPLPEAFRAQLIAIGVLTLLIPLIGGLSDRLGRKPLLRAASLLLLLVLWPFFRLLCDHPSFATLLLTQTSLCACLALFLGPVAAAIGEQLPIGVRSTGLAIGYNLAVMLFGGFAQFTVTALIQHTGELIAPVYYLLFASAIGLIAASFVRPQEARQPA